ncbi:hypothetical protein ACQQ2N_18100 [Dokdonella sp. MW10]|uniref:hypothetical protein n=1 Tax=Dokdonella sp. MW10 TaxID=2992926 RepID=UPI003F7FE4C3
MAMLAVPAMNVGHAFEPMPIPAVGDVLHRLGPVGEHGWGDTDLDGDGRVELVTSSNGPAAIILVYGRVAGSSAIRLKQRLYGPPDSIRALATASTGDTRVVTVSPDAWVTRYGGWPLAPIGSFPLGHTATLARIGDIDADGTLELLVAGDGRLSAHTLADGTLKWSMKLQVADIALAALDSDPALEIIVAGGDGSPGIVLDGATLMPQWQRAEGFGSYVAAGALGESREPGFIGAPDWGALSGYTAAPYAHAWTLDNVDTDGVAVGDTDGDGREEFVVGDGQWGSIRVYDAPTRQMLYTIRNGAWGMWAVGMLDLDGDRREEVWYSARIEQSTDRESSFAAAILNPINELPRLVIESRPHGATATLLADVDQDGRSEWWVGTSVYGAYKGLLRMMDTATTEERWRAPYVLANSFEPFQMTYRSLHAAQLDDDPALEVVAVGGNGESDFRILVLDGSTKAVQAQIPQPITRWYRTPTSSRLVQHVPGGPPELLVASYQYAAPQNVWLEVYALPGGERLWSSPTLGGMYDCSMSIDVGNLDDDPSDEYLLAHTRGLTAFDAATGQIDWTLEVPTAGAIIVPQGQGTEIYSISPLGVVDRYDARTLQAVGSFPLPGPIETLARLPGRDDWLLAVAGERLLLIDREGNVLRTSDWIGAGPGFGDSLSVVRDGNGWRVSIGRSFTTYQMWIVESDVVFTHGFE